MNKFFSDKSKAKSRGLAKVGDKALAAADELLFKGEDGRWGYCVEAAELKQYEDVTGMKFNPETTEVELDSAGEEVGEVEDMDVTKGFDEVEAPAHNPWETKVPEITGAVTTVVNGHKTVSQPAKVEKTVAPKEEKAAPRPSYKGYKINKDRPMQNGVKRPSANTTCGQVWAELDAIQEKNGVVTSADLPALVEVHNWNRNNVSCEYYNWRKFMGIARSSK